MAPDEAIKVAIDAVKEMFGGSDHRLEEIELKPGGGYDVTVSYRGQSAPPTPVTIAGDEPLFRRTRTAIGVDASRTYKDVEVGPEGVVKAVRIRQIVVG